MEKLSLTPENERQLTMRIIQYVLEHERVTLKQISDALDLDQANRQYLYSYSRPIQANIGTNSPEHILVFVSRPDSNKVGKFELDEYQLTPTAYFSYIDYLEIRDARMHAKEAKQLADKSIRIALWSLIVTSVLGL